MKCLSRKAWNKASTAYCANVITHFGGLRSRIPNDRDPSFRLITIAFATRTETMADWIGRLCDALEFTGGVPEALVPDNPKALIARPDR